MRSGTYTVYKSLGAAQFSLIFPRFNSKGFVERDGAVFLEVATGNGSKDAPKWDWDTKISFALGVADIAALLDENKPNPRLIHDNNGVVKTLQFVPGNGKYEGTYILQISQGASSDKKSVSVPFTNGEFSVVMRLLVSALPKIIAWDQNNVQGED